MFIKFRKYFCRFLIPVSFLTYPLFFFISSEKVNAEVIKYKCELQTYILESNDNNWEYLQNRYWELNVDEFNKSLIQKYTLNFKDKKLPIQNYFKIISLKKDSLVAIEEDMRTFEGGPQVSTITFKKIENSKDTMYMTYTNHMQNNGYDFTVHYGPCYRN